MRLPAVHTLLALLALVAMACSLPCRVLVVRLREGPWRVDASVLAGAGAT